MHCTVLVFWGQPIPPSVALLSRLSWKWRKRSSVKIAERTYEKRAHALHCRGSAYFDRLGIGLARQDVALDVEHARARGIKVVVKLFGYGDARRDDERARRLESKRGENNTSGLAATDGQDNSDFPLLAVRVGGELG